MGDELIAVLEGNDLFEMRIWLHAPQIAIRHVVNRVARQLGRYNTILVDEPFKSWLYPGWIPKGFRCEFGASGNYVKCWRDFPYPYILSESYSCKASYSIGNCVEMIEALYCCCCCCSYD